MNERGYVVGKDEKRKKKLIYLLIIQIMFTIMFFLCFFLPNSFKWIMILSGLLMYCVILIIPVIWFINFVTVFQHLKKEKNFYWFMIIAIFEILIFLVNLVVIAVTIFTK